MLYATTRSKVATYTAQRALKEERAPDGGLYVPTSLPCFTQEELTALLREEPAEIVARILNGFFKTKLGRLDVEFALGKRFFGLVGISHRIVIGELWRNTEYSFEGLCRRLTDRISAEEGIREPGLWMRIACRIALIFAMFAKLRAEGTIRHSEIVDAAVLTGNFEGPYALWTARKMGLPIGQIVCCCNENSGVWDLINRGQMKLGAKVVPTQTPRCDTAVPAALELLIHDRLEGDDMEEYLAAREKGGTFYLGPEEHRHFRDGFYASVIGGSRVKMAIPNLYRTNGYILCPYSALVYAGLMDYRSRPGPRRTALMLTDYAPRECADTITRTLDMKDQELRDWCRCR